jgi:4-hydroxythreonine-4-phosphate dehydrogenase
MGDPDGLGPELLCRFFNSQGAEGIADVPMLIVGPESALVECASRLGLAVFWERVHEDELFGPGPLDAVRNKGPRLFVPADLEGFSPQPGVPRVEGGYAAGTALAQALRIIAHLREMGQSAALCTCPLNKAMLQGAGFPFSGHTEFLADFFGLGPDGVCMHLGGPKLKVSLVTTHPPLHAVPKMISREKILHCLRLTADLLRKLGEDDKPIAVCGVNPHAGESGRIGDEEEGIIGPAVEAAQSEGLNVVGPLPGDTVFHFAYQGQYAAVLAMYHDQGLAPLKLVHFSEAVNITLGLPIVRTSPDHGTAYDLVGAGTADMTSFSRAVETAVRLFRAE